MLVSAKGKDFPVLETLETLIVSRMAETAAAAAGAAGGSGLADTGSDYFRQSLHCGLVAVRRVRPLTVQESDVYLFQR